MTVQPKQVNAAVPATAPLTNVALFMQLVDQLQNRAYHLPGLGVFYGPSGYGKTCSAIYGANKAQAYYVEVGASWGASTLVDAIYHELTGLQMKGTIAIKVAEVIRLLADDNRPLIIDECDHLVKKVMIDVVREISDKSASPVILIGEEQLPDKLLPFERAHNRVLSWTAAQPSGMTDARALAKLYAPAIQIKDDLLNHVVEMTDGVTRRIVTNIDNIKTFAAERGLTAVGLGDWQDQLVYTGRPLPRPRQRKAKVA